MRILVVGSGGREHALAWRLSGSGGVTAVYAAPGNSGTAQVGTNLAVEETDVEGMVAAARSHGIDLAVIGPEVPLALGLSDRLRDAGVAAFGPSRAASRLESSKSFARSVMDAAGVPGPNYRVFEDAGAALDYINAADRPLVVKADGLAAGKGVAMCASREEARAAVRACMDDRVFGEAGAVIVIEDWLRGDEVSVFGFTDGARLSAVAAAADYKRVGEGEAGPNTGGMGSYGPPGFWNEGLAERIRRDYMLPVIRRLAELGSPYRGALYCGVMLTDEGPRVLEFNCRFGDPETQVIMPRLLTDPALVMLACAVGELGDAPAAMWSERPAVGVVMASAGYPGAYRTGYPIAGLSRGGGGYGDGKSKGGDDGAIVFHAGARRAEDGSEAVVTAGGRVLTVVGLGDTVGEARGRAYRRIAGISFEGAFYRRDIAGVAAAAADAGGG